MAVTHSESDLLVELLIHFGRAARCEEGASPLTAAQWTCLRFFARANGPARTPSAFADFHATTRGAASQIVRSLERRGLIAGTRSDSDRRSVRFDLTQAGRAMLDHDPLRSVIALADRLAPEERRRFLQTLQRLGAELARLRGAPAFGACRDCSHFTPAGARGHCACMAAVLTTDDIDTLCASFTPSHAVPTPGEHHVRS